MRKSLVALAASVIAACASVVGPGQVSVAAGTSSTNHSGVRGVNCSITRYLCTEVADSDDAFGHYVGHDEPSLLFNSNAAGSGNQMRYSGILPTEPTATNVPGKHTYDFQLFPALWFGMAMCDTQSYPNVVRSCIPDSDANISRAGSPYHPGTAYMELQFYPPGYVQQWNGFSCSGRQWCAALTIDSFSENPLTGQTLNNTCASRAGLEYVNFAYLTHSGKPQGPPSPLSFDPIKSGTPDPAKVALLNPGDHFVLTMHDTAHGLQTVVQDTTNGTVGKMTASAANGFAQVKFAPKGTSCTSLPYDFHPMYSTSSPKTVVPWAAATYNIAIDTEIGHFDFCSKVDPATASCVGQEGAPGNQEKADADDNACFPGSAATLIKITGCLDSNIGYDGTAYLPDWPDGTKQRPTPTIFTSPKTGANYTTQYTNVAFNTDLPAIEHSLKPACNADTGANCTLTPPTDDGTPAAFYPYYTSGRALGGCAWTVGQRVPGFSTADYGKAAQYGHLLKVTYPSTGGTTRSEYNDFQQTLPNNPCPAP